MSTSELTEAVDIEKVRAIAERDDHLHAFIQARIEGHSSEVSEGAAERRKEIDRALAHIVTMLVLSNKGDWDTYDLEQTALEAMGWTCELVYNIPFWKAVLQRSQGKIPSYNSESRNVTNWKGNKNPR